MRLMRNAGTDRAIDVLRASMGRGHQLDALTPTLSLYAFAELLRETRQLARCRLMLPPDSADLALQGTAADRALRNRLQGRWLASRLGQWIESKVDVRRVASKVPQGALIFRDGHGPSRAGVDGFPGV